MGNPEVRQIVDSVVSDALHILFEWNPVIFTMICNKALAAQAASIAAKAAREMVYIIYIVVNIYGYYLLIMYNIINMISIPTYLHNYTSIVIIAVIMVIIINGNIYIYIGKT